MSNTRLLNQLVEHVLCKHTVATTIASFAQLVEHAPCKHAVSVETPCMQEAGIRDRNKPAEAVKRKKKEAEKQSSRRVRRRVRSQRMSNSLNNCHLGPQNKLC